MQRTCSGQSCAFSRSEAVLPTLYKTVAVCSSCRRKKRNGEGRATKAASAPRPQREQIKGRQQPASVPRQDHDTANPHPRNPSHQANTLQTTRRPRGTTLAHPVLNQTQHLGNAAAYGGRRQRVHRWAVDTKGPTGRARTRSKLQGHMHQERQERRKGYKQQPRQKKAQPQRQYKTGHARRDERDCRAPGQWRQVAAAHTIKVCSDCASCSP
jgi:hypothetical protein